MPYRGYCTRGALDCWNFGAVDLRCHIGIIAQMRPWTVVTSGLQTSDAIMGPTLGCGPQMPYLGKCTMGSLEC